MLVKGVTETEELPMMIRIQSTAHRDDVSEDEVMDLLLEGTLSLDEDTAVIRYVEMTDDEPQQVEIVIRDDMATVNRGGEYASQMMFRMGSRSEGIYQTPFGKLELATYCTRLSFDVTEEGGRLLLCYQLDMNGHFAAVHEIDLRMVARDD